MVGGHVQNATRLQHTAQTTQEIRTDKPLHFMFILRPGVGTKEMKAVDALRRQLKRNHLKTRRPKETHIREAAPFHLPVQTAQPPHHHIVAQYQAFWITSCKGQRELSLPAAHVQLRDSRRARRQLHLRPSIGQYCNQAALPLQLRNDITNSSILSIAVSMSVMDEA